MMEVAVALLLLVAIAAPVTHVTFTLAECVTSERIHPWTSNISANNVQSKFVGSISAHARISCMLHVIFCARMWSRKVNEKLFSFLLFCIFFHRTIRHQKFLTQITPKKFGGGLNGVLLGGHTSMWYFMLPWLTKNPLAVHEMFILVCDFVMVTTLHRFNIITGISISIMENHTCNSTQKHNNKIAIVCVCVNKWINEKNGQHWNSFLLSHLLWAFVDILDCCVFCVRFEWVGFTVN